MTATPRTILMRMPRRRYAPGAALLPSLVLLAIILGGCPSTERARKGEEPSHPAPTVKKEAAPSIVIQFASLDLSRVAKKIERGDIDKFAAALKHERIDILCLQGITRYPGLASRVDPVDELAASAGMRVVFGETISISGQQHGNAVFSIYPIRSSENTHYEGLHSSSFEAALQAIVDCGARDAVFISTQLPSAADPGDQSACINTLGTFNDLYVNKPIVISGNLPSASGVSAVAAYDAMQGSRPKDAPEVWYSNDGSLKPLSMKVERTALGPLVILPLGIFSKTPR